MGKWTSSYLVEFVALNVRYEDYALENDGENFDGFLVFTMVMSCAMG